MYSCFTLWARTEIWNAQHNQGSVLSPKSLLLSRITSISNFSFKILTKPKPRKLNQKSAPKSRSNFSFEDLTRIKLQSNVSISTNIQLQNLDQISASKPWPKIYLKISTKPQFQNLNQTAVNAFLSINISNTKNNKKFLVGSSRPELHQSSLLNRRWWVSEWQG